MTSEPMILVVEDEPIIRLFLEDTLQEEGFETVGVSTGQQALAELESDPTRFQAVVTDIRLGRGTDGWHVARRARELSPAMPVVYVSGDSVQDWAARGVPDSLMLAKPFVGAQVITALSTMLTHIDTR